MKSSHIVILACLHCFAVLPMALSAGQAVRLEPVLYLFRTIDHIDLSKALRDKPPSRDGGGVVFSQPAVVRFDQEQLELAGASYTWNGGNKAPPQFQETKMPTLINLLGQPATLRTVVPIQYLVKQPDGSLQLREISGNLPDMPHFQLTLTVQTATEPVMGYDLVVSCEMDISAVKEREKIPGVDLEVGRPVLTHLQKHAELWCKNGMWSALLADGTDTGDEYTLLLLLKVTLAGPAATSAAVSPVIPVAPPK